MTVKELIEFLQTQPQDIPVIRTYASDYEDLEIDQFQLLVPKDGSGIIRHHGHVMWLDASWLDDNNKIGWEYYVGTKHGPKPTNPELLTCLHLSGL